MTSPASHRGVPDPRRVPKQLAEWLGLAAAIGLALWLFFVALDPTTAALARRWGPHPRLLIFLGWLPVGGLLCAAAALALRHESLRRQGRRMSWVEEHLYGFIGLAWFGFALLMAGKQGRFEGFDPDAVIDHVALTSQAIAWGVSAGVGALVLTVLMAVGHLLATYVLRLPRPGWPLAWTAASWLLAGATVSLALAVLSI